MSRDWSEEIALSGYMKRLEAQIDNLRSAIGSIERLTAAGPLSEAERLECIRSVCWSALATPEERKARLDAYATVVPGGLSKD